MMTDDSLHLQVKTIETELSRAQSCLARGDIHACQLHQLLAMSSFLSLMGAIQPQQTGKLGRCGVTVAESAADVASVRSYGNIDVTDADNQGKIRFSERWAVQAGAARSKSEFGLGVKLQIPPGATVDMAAAMADDISAPKPVAAAPEPQPPVRQSLRWEHVPDDFGGKMCLFVGAFDIIGIQQDEDDNERAYYFPSTSWHHLENTIEHWQSSILRRDDCLDQLMRTPEQAMRWTEEQLKLPILPTWLNGEQVTLEAAPEPQEPVWRESQIQADAWMLMIGSHRIGSVYDGDDDRWRIDGSSKMGPYTFEGARSLLESANGLRPCRVIR